MSLVTRLPRRLVATAAQASAASVRHVPRPRDSEFVQHRREYDSEVSALRVQWREEYLAQKQRDQEAEQGEHAWPILSHCMRGCPQSGRSDQVILYLRLADLNFFDLLLYVVLAGADALLWLTSQATDSVR